VEFERAEQLVGAGGKLGAVESGSPETSLSKVRLSAMMPSAGAAVDGCSASAGIQTGDVSLSCAGLLRRRQVPPFAQADENDGGDQNEENGW
jgi:hypothetical protein